MFKAIIPQANMPAHVCVHGHKVCMYTHTHTHMVQARAHAHTLSLSLRPPPPFPIILPKCTQLHHQIEHVPLIPNGIKLMTLKAADGTQRRESAGEQRRESAGEQTVSEPNCSTFSHDLGQAPTAFARFAFLYHRLPKLINPKSSSAFKCAFS